MSLERGAVTHIYALPTMPCCDFQGPLLEAQVLPCQYHTILCHFLGYFPKYLKMQPHPAWRFNRLKLLGQFISDNR